MWWFLLSLLLASLANSAPTTAHPLRRDDAGFELDLASFVEANATNATSPTNSSAVLFPVAVMHPPSANGSAVAVTGVHISGCEAYLGIPFAESPIGQRRFAHPEPKVYNRNFTAILPAPACIQPNNTMSGKYGYSEDCLTLNVLAPRGTAGSGAGLPVMVWIYGGGFVTGAASAYISPPFINRSQEIDHPVILVTINYRLGILGFGYGEDIAKAGAANLALRDQVLALQWVKDNIASFGGDPNKVTVFGQSAGAISVALLMLNETTDLFRGAIMHSGAQSTAPLGNTSDLWNGPYNATAVAAGCMVPNTTNLGNLTTFECLKTVPVNVISDASATMRKMPQYQFPFVFAPSVDGDLVPDSPWKLLAAGKFAKLPFISGTTRDEGTAFAPVNLNGSDTLIQFLAQTYPKPVDPNITAQIFKSYPDVPALGSPFGTGNETWGLSSVFKQASAIIGDAAFQSRRRWFLRQANVHNATQTWSYDFWGSTPGVPPFLGIPHAADVPYVFGIATQKNNYTAAAEAMGIQMMDYWINFAYYLNPNGQLARPDAVQANNNGTAGNTTTTTNTTTGSSNSTRPFWPPHAFPGNHNSLRLDPTNVTVIQDTFREDQMVMFDVPSVASALFFKRGL